MSRVINDDNANEIQFVDSSIQSKPIGITIVNPRTINNKPIT
jgi:hypothetical protein